MAESSILAPGIRMAYRAKVRLNVGLGYRLPGELVAEAEEWPESTIRTLLEVGQIERVYIAEDEKSPELHPHPQPQPEPPAPPPSLPEGAWHDDPELARVVSIRTSSEAEGWIEGQLALYQAGKDHRCGYGSKHLESGILRRLTDKALERLVRRVGELVWRGPVAPYAPTLDALQRFLKAEAYARNWETKKRRESEPKVEQEKPAGRGRRKA